VPLLTSNVFWSPGHERPNFDGSIYIQYTPPPYLARIRDASLLTSFCLAKFGWVPFADLCMQRLATKQNRIHGGCAKIPVLLQPVCGPKFKKLWDNVGGPRTSQCLCPIVKVKFRLEDIGH